MEPETDNSRSRGLNRPVPLWVSGLVALVSIALLVTFVWGVSFPPQPIIAPAFRDPEVLRKASLIRPGSALDRQMRLVDVEYSVVAREGEPFSVTYLNSKGKKVRVANVVATAAAGWDDNGTAVRSPDGILLKRWTMPLRIDPDSLLLVSAQSKDPTSSLEVSIWVDAFDACRTRKKTGAGTVSCQYQMP